MRIDDDPDTARRRTEAWLLEQIKKCPDPATWDHYQDLVAKRRAETLTAGEHAELLALTEQIEMGNVHRLERLAELARLRGTTLRGIMQQLGIRRPSYA